MRAAGGALLVSVVLLGAPGLVRSQASPPPSAPPYDTIFYSHDGLKLEAYLYRPPGRGPFPLVVYNHGSRQGEERAEWPVAFIARLLTEQGYAVLVPERRGYGRSEGKTFSEEIGTDRGPRYVARLEAETGDLLAAVQHVVTAEGSAGTDPRRIAVMGWSFGGIVTTFAAARTHDFAAVIVQAPGALTWDHSPPLQAALRAAAARSQAPILCMVAENDATTESTREVCRNAGGPKELKVYPPFTPAQARSAPGHALFSPQGVAIWGKDALAFLGRYLRGPSS